MKALLRNKYFRIGLFAVLWIASVFLASEYRSHRIIEKWKEECPFPLRWYVKEGCRPPEVLLTAPKEWEYGEEDDGAEEIWDEKTGTFIEVNTHPPDYDED